MIEYKILYQADAFALSQEVTKFIEKGWKPIGGVGADNVAVYQTVIREKAEDALS